MLRRPYRPSNNPEHKSHSTASIGKLGERCAALWLQRQGHRILRRNYRSPVKGEIDIIYRDHKTLVFCEVKTRTSTTFGYPSRAVNAYKKRLIKRASHTWLKALGGPVLYRYDIIEVILQQNTPPQIRHIPHAFSE